MLKPTPDNSAACVWTHGTYHNECEVFVSKGDVFSTSCNQTDFTNEPSNPNFKYCPYCGNLISESSEED